MKKLIVLIALIALSTFAYAQNTYTLDQNHARITFSVKHFGISFVEGIFKSFDAKLISAKEDFSDAQIEMSVDVKSINTEIEMRDKDLRESWFETDKYPTFYFKSTSFVKVSENNYKLTGNVNLHGVIKEITFDVVYNGKAQNPFTKKYSVGFTVSGIINRNDFGIGKETFPTVANQINLRSNLEFIVN